VHKNIIYCYYVFLACLLGAMFKEFYHLKAERQHLHTLQYEYQKYLAYYKQMVAKKKYDTEFFFAQETQPEHEFKAVNRELVYLKESAMQLAQEHGIGPAMEQLYNPSAVVRTPPKKKITRKKHIPVTGKGLLQWPIDPELFWISSRFGSRRNKDGSNGFHHGLDMAALRGTPVKAALKGVVIEAGYSEYGYGNRVVINHNQEKMTTRYAHLDKVLVKVGESVKAGTVIGRVGNTGFVRGRNGHASATHLHFEVALLGKKRIDPLLLLT
jgi:murein DD-endopeptidase MepM/ murein hydrolase activator NlpD